jgi:hypothetical protein
MADKADVAVISVTHFNKSGGGSALNKVMGSAAFTAAPRAAFAVIRDATDTAIRMMLSLKSNIAKAGTTTGMKFKIVERYAGEDDRDQTDVFAPCVEWLGPADITADQALAAQEDALRRKRSSPALDEAKDFLRNMLRDGRKMPVKEIDAEARAAGIAVMTLRRARELLGIVSEKVEQRDGRGPWLQWLPTEDDFAADDGEDFSP